MMKKRILAFALSLCLIFSMIPVLGVSAVGTEKEFSLNRIGYQGEYPRYLIYLDLADVTDVSAATVPDGSKVVATVNGSAMNLWAYTATASQIFLVFEVALGDYLVEIDAGTVIGSYIVKSDLKIKIAEYTANQLEIVRLGIDTTANNGGVIFNAGGVARYSFALTGISGQNGAVGSLTVNGNSVTGGFEYLSGYPAAGNQALFVYYNTLMSGATDAGDITQLQTISIPAGTIFGNCITENTLTFTIQQWTFEVLPEAINIESTNGSAWNGSQYILYLHTDLPFTLTATQELSVQVNGADKTVYLYANNGNPFIACESAVAYGENKITIPKGTQLGDCVTAQDYTLYTHTDGTIDQTPSQTAVSFTFASGTWQYSDNRYLVYLDHDLGKDMEVAWAPLNVLSVDGRDVSVYALGGSQLMLVLDSTVGITAMGEHEITLKKGTFIGDYEIANDVTFYTHADGTVDGVVPSTAMNFTFASGTWQYSDNRYLVYLDHDLGKDMEVAWAPLDVLSMDGGDVSVYALGGSQIVLILDSAVGITAMGEHTFVLKKGTFIGEHEIAEDITFYTHADGTVNQEAPSAPVNFSFSHGVWQVSDSRYLVWLESDVAGELSVPWVPLDGITVNGEKATVYAVVDSGMVMLVLDQTSGIANPGKYTVSLKQGSHIGKYELAEDVTFYTDGLTVTAEAPVQIPEPSETVTVDNDSRNLNGTCKDYFYFQVSPADALPFDEENETARYGAAKGGIYVNGELTSISIIKLLSNLYYIPLGSFGYPPQKGDVVTIDGVFGNGEYAVTYEKQSFVYDGEGNWKIGTYLRDLREQEYIVQDISELKMGVSEFELEPGVTLIGEAKRGTNIAIRTVVSTDLETDEFNFGFSKIEGMWDVEKSGWQVWLRPQWNQVFLAHGESDWQVTGHYEFTKEEFTVEFGTVDMHEYIDGKDVGLYCRKIFLKIDGVEVLSYEDTDFARNVGKKLFVFNSADAAGSKLISLTSKGVKLRELTPTVYDYYDLTGFAADTVSGGTTAYLGETADSTNVAVRMKLNMSTDSSELRLALSKQQKDNFWDVAGSGWQVWLRPRWNMLYIAHGENDYEVIMGHTFNPSFTVEFGTRDIIVEKDGKYVDTYCREVYLLIDGKEIATWEDTDFGRELGNCVMLLTAQDTTANVFTLQQTVTLPAQILVNGETVENCELLQMNPQVVVGQDSKISLIYSSDENHKTTFGGLYHNGEKLEPLEESGGKVVYLLKNPAQTDRLKVELTMKELTADEPTDVFDLFEIADTGVIEVPARTTVSIGAMLNRDGQGAANTAVRFAIRLPQVFNAAQLTILADNDNPWSNSGAMLQIIPNQINLCYSAQVKKMDSFASSLFAPGNLVCVEFGIVKCYENGVYKYDRWYVKAGQTADTMELIGWYDSIERGHYGSHFCCHGSDMEESYYLYSLKDIYSLTDESSEENKALLRTYQQLTNVLPELYYPDALVGYSTLEQAEQEGRISLYTRPGTKLSRLTVNGQDVQFTVGTDGAYCYTLPSVTGDVRFAYEITADDTHYTVAAVGDDTLRFSLPEDGVLAGDDLNFAVTAQKGFVPQVTVNGTDVLLTVNEETGVWYGCVKSIRQNTEIIGKAAEKNYTISVNTPNNGGIILGGDVLNGKLPFGGRLEVTVQPNSGCYIQSVFIDGVEMPADETGKVIVEAVYWDVEEISVEAVLVQAHIPQVQQSSNGSQTWLWIGLGVLAVIAAAGAAIFLGKRKSKKGEMKK